MAYSGSQVGNSASLWTSGYSPLEGHSAFLPGSTNDVFTEANGGFWSFPFWRGYSSPNNYHWGVRGLGSRWECDDFPGGSGEDTLHRIYVK